MLKPSRLLILLVVIAAPVAMGPRSDTAANQTARLILPDTSGTVLDTLRLALDIEDADSVQAALIDVSFDPAILVPDPGSLELGAFGQSIQNPGWSANIPSPGLFRMAFFTSDVTGYVGSGTLVTFECALIGAGTSPLAFTQILLEQLPNIELPAVGDDGSVEVEPLPVEEGSWGRLKHQYAGAN
jgi:hypothetical protein